MSVDVENLVLKDCKILLNEALQTKIKDEIICIQRLTSREHCVFGVQFFLKKYTDFPESQEFLEKFRKLRDEKNSKCYEGIYRPCPKTNDAKESYNSEVKNDYFFGKVLKLERAIKPIVKCLRDHKKYEACTEKILFTSENSQSILCLV